MNKAIWKLTVLCNDITCNPNSQSTSQLITGLHTFSKDFRLAITIGLNLTINFSDVILRTSLPLSINSSVNQWIFQLHTHVLQSCQRHFLRISKLMRKSLEHFLSSITGCYIRSDYLVPSTRTDSICKYKYVCLCKYGSKYMCVHGYVNIISLQWYLQ